MKKYEIVILNNTSETSFISTSRNAKKHLKKNGGNNCKVYYKNKLISEAMFTPEGGGKIYSLYIEQLQEIGH